MCIPHHTLCCRCSPCLFVASSAVRSVQRVVEKDRGGQSAAQGGHFHRRQLPWHIRGADSGGLMIGCVPGVYLPVRPHVYIRKQRQIII